MLQSVRWRWLLAGALIVSTAAAHAQIEMTGQTSGGAYYRILVPPGWQPADGLAIWNHGFDLDPIGPLDDDDMGPLAPLQLSEGFAVAASSYSLTGWAVFETVQDNEEMVRAFEDAFGVPDQVFVYGASLGGIVTAQAIEKADLGNVVGAMPICGAVAGSRLWDGAVDLRLLYDLICDAVPGAALPGDVHGLPIPPDPNFDTNALIAAVDACFGLISGPDPEQGGRLGQMLALSGLPPEFIITDLGFATFALTDLVRDPRKLNGRMPFTNVGVDYGDPAVNAAIERVDADPFARLFLHNYYTPTGDVGDVKIVSLHTDKDGLVIVENENEYAQVVPPQNLTVGIVVEDAPTHCGFSEAEVVAAWETLRAWVGGFPQPTAADLQASCLGLEAVGLAEGPCRIDPTFVVPDLDGRVRPRPADAQPPPGCMAGPNALCLHGDRFQAEVHFDNGRGLSGAGQSLPVTNHSGSFFFFNPENVELTLKVLDGSQVNDHFWVFYGSLTNVEFDLTVTDVETGRQKTYHNDPGTFASVGDTLAFDSVH